MPYLGFIFEILLVPYQSDSRYLFDVVCQSECLGLVE